MARLTASQVAYELGISVYTLKRWYKWYETEDIEQLKKFKEFIPNTRGGFMGSLNKKGEK